jgi:hypothetical protein
MGLTADNPATDVLDCWANKKAGAAGTEWLRNGCEMPGCSLRAFSTVGSHVYCTVCGNSGGENTSSAQAGRSQPK